MRLCDMVGIADQPSQPSKNGLPDRPINKDKLPFSGPVDKSLFITHVTHVNEEVRSICHNKEKIFTTKDAIPSQNNSLTTILYHGIVGPSRITSVITGKDGNKTVKVEKLG